MTLPRLLFLLFLVVPPRLSATVSVNGFAIEKGINISHTLSQVPTNRPHPAREVYFTEKDVILIKYAGFDHLRLPIDEIQMWDETGAKVEAAWAYLHQVIAWCQRHDLRIIVDLHTVRAHHFNAANDGGAPNRLWTDASAQETFLRLWRDIMGELGTYPNDVLAYELLNEAVAPTHDDWNDLVAKTMRVIRAQESERVVVIGSNMWQSYATLPALRVPENDPNLIVSFHFYDPFLVTHYATSWNFMRDYDGPIQYPGVPIPTSEVNSTHYPKAFWESAADHLHHWDINEIESRIVKAIQYAQDKGLPIYCGEWGCYYQTPRDLRMKLTQDTIAVFEKHNIARASWDYQGSFGIFHRDGSIDWEILHAILGK